MERILLIGLAISACNAWLLWPPHWRYQELIVRDDDGRIVFVAAALGSAVVKVFWDELP